MPEITIWRIFVSYSHVDGKFTEEFVEVVRNSNPDSQEEMLCVWYDQLLMGGVKWWDKILEEISRCHVFICLLSKESIISSYCNAEYQEATRLNKPVLPILVHNLTSIPDHINEYQIIDLAGGLNDGKTVSKLIGSIYYHMKQEEKARSLPPKLPIPTTCPPVSRKSEKERSVSLNVNKRATVIRRFAYRCKKILSDQTFMQARYPRMACDLSFVALAVMAYIATALGYNIPNLFDSANTVFFGAAGFTASTIGSVTAFSVELVRS